MNCGKLVEEHVGMNVRSRLIILALLSGYSHSTGVTLLICLMIFSPFSCALKNLIYLNKYTPKHN